MFKVRTDEEFFYRFLDLQAKLRSISGTFQNEGTEATYDQWKECLESVKEFKVMFNDVTEEANKRFELIE